MRCRECVKECKERGDLCAPPDPESLFDPTIRDLENTVGRDHRESAHLMRLVDGSYHCGKGHLSVEAPPVDAMRAAGMEPML